MNQELLTIIKTLVSQINEAETFINENSRQRKAKRSLFKEKDEFILENKEKLMRINNSIRYQDSELDKMKLSDINTLYSNFEIYIKLSDSLNTEENNSYLEKLRDYKRLRRGINLAYFDSTIPNKHLVTYDIIRQNYRYKFFYNTRLRQYRALNILVDVTEWDNYDFDDILQVDNFDSSKLPRSVVLSFAIPFSKNYSDVGIVPPEGYDLCTKCSELCSMGFYHTNITMSGKYDRRYHLNGEYDLIEKSSLDMF